MEAWGEEKKLPTLTYEEKWLILLTFSSVLKVLRLTM